MSKSERVALAFALLVAACVDGSAARSPSTAREPEPSPGGAWILRLVGAVEETDVRVAVLLGSGKARLFFCGGPQSYAVATRWFDVWYDGGEHVDFEEQSWRVHAHLVEDGLIGEVILPDAVTRTIKAELVAPSTLAGLYEGKADCGRVGLIISQTSMDALPAAQGACIDLDRDSVQEISPVTPITSDEGKVRVRNPGGGEATLLLQAAVLDPV